MSPIASESLPQRPGIPVSESLAIRVGRCGSDSRQSPSGSRPSITRSSSSGGRRPTPAGSTRSGTPPGSAVRRAGSRRTPPAAGTRSGGRLEQRHASRFASCPAVAGQPGRDERGVVRPDRAVVVLDAGCSAAARRPACARPSRRTVASPIRCATSALDPLVGARCRSTAGGRCWRSAVDRPLVAVQGQRVEAARRQPEVAVEALAAARRRRARAGRRAPRRPRPRGPAGAARTRAS